MWSKMVTDSKGVRRVPISTRSLTGEVNGQEFESALERDLMLLMFWSRLVDSFQSQPVCIEYRDSLGKRRNYTPDLLVTFHPQEQRQPKPLLIEVKYRKDLIANLAELKPKFRAARRFARERGWTFKIMTEVEIRTPYLDNVRFLWRYRDSHWTTTHYDRLRQTLREMEEAEVNTLLAAAYTSQSLRDEALWTLWAMVAIKVVKCDLTAPLTMNTRVWLDE
jgi:hypothetical protein